MLAEILLGAEASRPRRELFNSRKYCLKGVSRRAGRKPASRSILIALGYDRSRALPGSRKINSKSKAADRSVRSTRAAAALVPRTAEDGGSHMAVPQRTLIQEVLAIQRISLRGAKAGVADDAAEFFFGGAIVDAGGADYILFKHHRADVVAAEAQSHLEDFESLCDPTRLHIQEVREIQARDGQHLQIFHRSRFVPVTAAESGVVRLEAPGDEGGEAAGFFLQIVKFLQVVNAVFVVLAYAKHHGCGGAHPDLVGGAMNIDPVVGQAFEARNFVAHFIVENFGAAAGNGIEPSVAQAENCVANAEAAVLGDRDNLGSGVAMEMHLRKAIFNPAQHFFVPIDFEVGMQAALH